MAIYNGHAAQVAKQQKEAFEALKDKLRTESVFNPALLEIYDLERKIEGK